MSPRTRHALTLLASAPAFMAAALVSWWLLSDFAVRVAYPFDIEWMEGGMLVHVLRFRQGLGVYLEPSADWVPYIYPPLYPWFLSLLGEPSYALARSLSMLGTFAAAAAAVMAVRQVRGPAFAGFGAAAAFLSCYALSGGFYDLVRSDAFALGLASWALVLCHRGSRWPVRIGGVLLVLAYLAKHNYAAFGVPILFWLWGTQGRGRALDFVLWCAVPALVITGAIQLATDGLFLTYLLEVPGAHPLVGERAFPKAPTELATSVMLVSGGGLLAGLLNIRRANRDVAYWLPNLALMLGLCILMRAHHGGFINVLMPGHWMLAVCGGMALGALYTRWPHPLMALVLAPIFAVQVAINQWDRDQYLPTAPDHEAGERLIAAIAERDGSVYAPHFPWYPYMAGKEPSTPLIAIWDIEHKDGPLYPQSKSIKRAVKQQRWDNILTTSKGLKHGVEIHYQRDGRFKTTKRALTTKTGWRVVPAVFWVPKPPEEPSDEDTGEDGVETSEPPTVTP